MHKKKSLESALHEVEGVKTPSSTSDYSIKKIKLKRSEQPTENVFVEKILTGDISHLSRAITLIESTNPKHQEKANAIIEQCLPYANKSIRIGITGVPGVGKSTFIEVFAKQFTEKDHKV
ncbi:MAG: methylmalonyl Co-A mutase-associated GTPase MeaB, partial [Lutibacter sp.]